MHMTKLRGPDGKFHMGRRRLKWRVFIVATLMAVGMVYGRFFAPSQASSLRQGTSPLVEDTPTAFSHGRRLSTTGAMNCTAEPAKAELSVISAIVGPGLCDSRADTECLYCCTGFDMTIGVPVYFIIMLYMFLGLAIICDDYFCESLDAISEALSLSEDVAGATFMAAGSSAPELFTAIVTVLITGGSEGLGTIVGSAIFNIMIIVGVTAIFAGQVLKVWWYPLTRDCVVYFISILGMVWAIADKEVQWWEAMTLVLCYGGYIALMVFNDRIVKKVKTCERGCKDRNTRKAEAKKAAGNPAPLELQLQTLASKKVEEGPVTNESISAAAKRLARRSLEESSLTEASKAAARASIKQQQGTTNGTPEAWNGSPTAKPTLEDAPSTPEPSSAGQPKSLLAKVSDSVNRMSPKVTPSPAPSVGSAMAAEDKSQVGTPSPFSLHTRLGSGKSRTDSNLSLSQVKAALEEESKDGASTTSGAEKSPALAAMAGSFRSTGQKYAVPKPKKAETKAEEEEKKKSRRMKPEYRKVWGGSSEAKKRRKNKRAEKQVRVTMKVAVAASRFKKGLLRARSARAAAGGAAGGGGSKLLAAMARVDPEKAIAKAAAPAPAPADDDEEGSKFDKFLEIVGWPLATAMRYTTPACGEEKWEKWYMVTFTMSILWIGLLSYVMVDMAGRAGCILGVPGLVMGLVVLAAGTSVPDALSSILVAKLGQGDMAVANVLGSNVFNILLGLGLPWMARALMDGHPVILPAEEEIVQPVIVLLLYLAFFIAVVALSGWKLSKLLGGIFIAAHFVFLAWNLLTLLPDPVIKL